MARPVNSLDDLERLDRAALGQRWNATFGVPAPKSAQVNFLRGALAWHSQAATAPQADVANLMRQVRQVTKAQGSGLALTPGTRLLREWQGRTHHVTVLDRGFEYEGTTYKSLTAIALQITGTPWSGPLFFGVRK